MGDSKGGPGSCRKSRGWLYVERGGGPLLIVIPAKAGIHVWLGNMDSRLRGNDVFLRSRGRRCLLRGGAFAPHAFQACGVKSARLSGVRSESRADFGTRLHLTNETELPWLWIRGALDS